MPFTFQIQTTENNQTFGFIADAGTLYIDWGDSQNTTESTPTTGLRSHSYSTAGTYNISLTGTATRIAFYGTGATPTLLIDVLTKMSDGLTGITSANSMFRGCTQITTFTEPAFFDDVSGNVTSIQAMFMDATNFNGDISSWNTSKVTTMANMFYGASSFNQDISSWNTSKVTNMTSMFRGASSFNQPINSWNVSNVLNFSVMFYNAISFNQDLNNWDTSSATSINLMFLGATNFNGNISNWDTSKITNMDGMFQGATSFNQPLNSWNVSKVTSFGSGANRGMFQDATSFNQPLNNWDTSSATRTYSMFNGATSFNQPIGNWDTSKVTNMENMFYRASSFNQDISNWNVSSVTTAINMFGGVTLPTVVYDGILIKWAKQILKPNVTINFGSSKYSNGLPLESKNKIASNFTWTIADGGSNGDTYIDRKKLRYSK